uniref:Cupin type-2 domain-containing protein n=1 Tax=Chloropicon primus TaxID=1764295 RepID=A0A7S2WXH9_9CHLO
MLSISVPVSLAAHKGVIAAQGAGGGSKTWSMDNRRSSSPVDRRNSMDVPAQIKLKQQETESCLLSSRLRRTAELLTFQLPSMNNRIAPVFDPFRDCTPFTCSIEILDPQGVIPRHLHDEAYELFIVLSGRADLYLNQSDEPVTGAEGDTLLVKPKNVHSIVNPDAAEKLYMLSIILPNETFAKQVWNGSYSGKLGTADVSHLID